MEFSIRQATDDPVASPATACILSIDVCDHLVSSVIYKIDIRREISDLRSYFRELAQQGLYPRFAMWETALGKVAGLIWMGEAKERRKEHDSD